MKTFLVFGCGLDMSLVNLSQNGHVEKGGVLLHQLELQ